MKRIVVKLGTGILTKGVGEIDTDQIKRICAQIAELRERGFEVLVVSSGAIGLGMGILNLKLRPNTLPKQQACAAIGQSRLMNIWQDGLKPFGIRVGQILLTHEGLKLRDRYLNAKSTIEQTLAYGVVPIINENDTVSTYEIQFGNNDLLSAMVASLSEASYLFILSTAPGLIDMDGTGEIIPTVDAITPAIAGMAKGTTSSTAVGGMVTKIQAAQLATESGCDTYIASGHEENVISRILDGETIGTHFRRSSAPMNSKKRWLAFFQRPNGTLVIDAGAAAALTKQGSSLLAPGILRVEGDFEGGSVVNIADQAGHLLAHGQTLFSSSEINEFTGNSARSAEPASGRRIEIVHRDALALI